MLDSACSSSFSESESEETDLTTVGLCSLDPEASIVFEIAEMGEEGTLAAVLLAGAVVVLASEISFLKALNVEATLSLKELRNLPGETLLQI